MRAVLRRMIEVRDRQHDTGACTRVRVTVLNATAGPFTAVIGATKDLLADLLPVLGIPREVFRLYRHVARRAVERVAAR